MDTKKMLARIDTELKKRGIAKQTFYSDCNITSASYSQWNTGKAAPSRRTIQRIAEYFGWSEDYLIAGKSSNAAVTVTIDEIEIIKKCRLLDENGLKTVLYIIDSEIRRTEEIAESRQNSANIIPLWRSLQPASAGRGFYLSADEFETIIVRRTDETKQAAFCVPVSGNSMEPLYHDGDILLVGREKTLSRGQIGIFTVDGKGYVKKLDEGVLVSLNADYPDIPMTDETYCNGNVIGILDKDKIL